MLNRDFFKADFDYPIGVLVLEDRARFKTFLQTELHIADPPNFGVYLFKYKLFVTFEDSGLGTFAHEILHPLVERNLKDRPAWAMEGIPTFFEKFYGYWKNDELVVQWGFQNPWRIEQLGTNLTHLDLRQTVADPQTSANMVVVERNESDLRMVSMFLWEQGRFQNFLQLIAAHKKNGYSSYFEAAMEMPVEKIVPLWQSYLENVATQRGKILTLPGSAILQNESDFKNFALFHGIPLGVSEMTPASIKP